MAKYTASKRTVWIKRTILFSIFLILAIGISLAASYLFMEYFQPAPLAEPTEKKASGVTEPISSLELQEYETITKDQSEIYKGPLILVNNQNLYQFTEEDALVSVLEEKQADYKVSDRNVKVNQKVMEPLDEMIRDFQKETGFQDLLVASGYRSKDLQESLFDREAEAKGEQEASLWVAKPGGSEHHTGYGIDFSIYTDQGVSLDYTGTGKCAWLNQNCYEYGFVVRFPKDKEELTGIDYEPWHFRYVGVPHAYVMTQNNLCLEEYIVFLKQYPFDQQHLNVQDDQGNRFEIYYVESQGEKTEIPVPKQQKYSASGNNQDGFVVTVEH